MSWLRKAVSTPLAPSPIGPYSQAIAVIQPQTEQQIIYLSGQIGLDVNTGKLADESFETEVNQAFINLKNVVEASGAKLRNVVKVNIFILDFANFPVVNRVMQNYFTALYPARSTIGVASLPLNANIEIEAIVHLPTTATTSSSE